MTKEELFEKVAEVVADKLGVEREKITMESKFREDLSADSLDMTELIMGLEEDFDIEIPEEDYGKIESVGDAVDYLYEKIANSN